ncbi:MAG: N-acetylmuramoyl-L-alanine amidase [Anaerolineae bacterium]|nr:N-acetylmuramoyl-L-alanine amidase [Anaerolineae bacterium]
MPNDPPGGSDDSRDHLENNDPDSSRPPEGVPASVEFMEMMRQAAARFRPASTPDNPVEVPLTPPPKFDYSFDEDEDEEFELADEYEDDLLDDEGKAQPTPRRKRRRRSRTIGIIAGIVRTMIIIVVAAGLTATIFTWFTPNEFLTTDVRESLSVAIATDSASALPTALPTPNWARRIGIVSGHRGPQNDPGAICPDGLTEAEINFNVAQQVVQGLQSRGYTVDLLDEFDPRLDGYQATALVSIHSNTCQSFGEVVSGFLVASAAARAGSGGTDEQLVDCLAQHYAVASGLERRTGVTVDMTDYHTFREINRQTTAAIIELGFMLADRDVLTSRPDALANGITDGILCYLEPGVIEPTVEGIPGDT